MRQLVEKLTNLVQPETPKRGLDISFRVLPPAPGEPAPSLNELRIAQRDADQAYPIDYLRTCLTETRKLSRCNLSIAKRVLVTEEFIKYFVPVAFKHIQGFSFEGGVPDPEPRQEILDAIIEVVRLLTESYKIAFRTAYRGGNSSLFHASSGAVRRIHPRSFAAYFATIVDPAKVTCSQSRCPAFYSLQYPDCSGRPVANGRLAA